LLQKTRKGEKGWRGIRASDDRGKRFLAVFERLCQSVKTPGGAWGGTGRGNNFPVWNFGGIVRWKGFLKSYWTGLAEHGTTTQCREDSTRG